MNELGGQILAYPGVLRERLRFKLMTTTRTIVAPSMTMIKSIRRHEERIGREADNGDAEVRNEEGKEVLIDFASKSSLI